MRTEAHVPGLLYFDINHPVQALMLRPVIEALTAAGHTARVFEIGRAHV